MYKHYNPNPDNLMVGDCVIRACCAALDQTWESTYMMLAVFGMNMSDMPSANRVWGTYLKTKGFERVNLPDECPDCYTVSDFCADHPYGTFILATGTHVIAVIDGDYYDSWDSGNEVPIYYWRKDAVLQP